MNGLNGKPERARGRPRRNQRGDIPDDLMRAFREVLAQKPVAEVTLREVAARAGTSPEMVRYYFSGKEGLIRALIDASRARVRASLERLTIALAEAERGHSRLIVACLGTIYLEERDVGKLFNSEFARARSRHREVEWSGRPDAIVEVLQDLVAGLIQRGIYRASLDPIRTAILIMSLTGCPVRLLDTLAPRWISEEALCDPLWIDDVAAMVDGCCLA